MQEDTTDKEIREEFLSNRIRVLSAKIKLGEHLSNDSIRRKYSYLRREEIVTLDNDMRALLTYLKYEPSEIESLSICIEHAINSALDLCGESIRSAIDVEYLFGREKALVEITAKLSSKGINAFDGLSKTCRGTSECKKCRVSQGDKDSKLTIEIKALVK